MRLMISYREAEELGYTSSPKLANLFYLCIDLQCLFSVLCATVPESGDLAKEISPRRHRVSLAWTCGGGRCQLPCRQCYVSRPSESASYPVVIPSSFVCVDTIVMLGGTRDYLKSSMAVDGPFRALESVGTIHRSRTI